MLSQNGINQENQVTIHVWCNLGTIKLTEVKHLALETHKGNKNNQGIYASFWPPSKKEEYNQEKFVIKAFPYGVFRSSDFDKQKATEADGKNYKKIILDGLDIGKINSTFNEFINSGNKSRFTWTRYNNCSGIIFDLLMAGGIFNTADFSGYEPKIATYLSKGIGVLSGIMGGVIGSLIAKKSASFTRRIIYSAIGSSLLSLCIGLLIKDRDILKDGIYFGAITGTGTGVISSLFPEKFQRICIQTMYIVYDFFTIQIMRLAFKKLNISNNELIEYYHNYKRSTDQTNKNEKGTKNSFEKNFENACANIIIEGLQPNKIRTIMGCGAAIMIIVMFSIYFPTNLYSQTVTPDDVLRLIESYKINLRQKKGLNKHKYKKPYKHEIKIVTRIASVFTVGFFVDIGKAVYKIAKQGDEYHNEIKEITGNLKIRR